jgi:hypothetical protein
MKSPDSSISTKITTAANYKQVINYFDKLPQDIKLWLKEVPDLVQKYDYEVSIALIFSRIESIKHIIIHRGLVKIHKTNSELTWEILELDHMSRDRFSKIFKTVFNCDIPKSTSDKIKLAERVRDKVMHGKSITGADARNALISSFEYLKEIDEFMQQHSSNIRPFGDGRGFKGRAGTLTKDTTRWVLRGMGLPPNRND